MITIEYCEEGRAVSDFAVESWLEDIMRFKERWPGQDWWSKVSSAIPVTAMRHAIVTGKITCEDVTFVFAGKSFQANKYGAIPDWPNGFCDRDASYSEQILRTAIDMRRAERAKILKEITPPCNDSKL